MGLCNLCHVSPIDNKKETWCPVCHAYVKWERRVRESYPVGQKSTEGERLTVPLHIGFIHIHETEAELFTLKHASDLHWIPTFLAASRSKIFDDGSKIPVPIDLNAMRVANPRKEQHK